MKKLLLAVMSALVFTGCYTVLLTRANMPVRQLPPAASVADSVQPSDSTLPPAAQAAPSASRTENRLLRNECDCTVFEISNGLCWCTCDRCGVYHRVGYEYCPRGWMYSSHRWDYYNDYPWWYNRYNNDYRYGSYYDGYRHDNYRYGGNSGGGSSAGNGRHNDSLGFIGDRNNFRDALLPPVSPPASSSRNYSVTVSPPTSYPTPAGPSQPPRSEISPAKTDTSKANFDRIMDRKRMR